MSYARYKKKNAWLKQLVVVIGSIVSWLVVIAAMRDFCGAYMVLATVCAPCFFFIGAALGMICIRSEKKNVAYTIPIASSKALPNVKENKLKIVRKKNLNK